MISDLIKKYEITLQYLDSLHNPRKKLIAIIDFFRTCEKENHFPPSFSFIEEFIPKLINIFRLSSINFIDPEYLKSAKKILIISKYEYGDSIVISQIDAAIDLINMQLLKMYFHLGEISDGIVILNNMVETGTGADYKSENIRSAIKNPPDTGKFTLVTKDTFRKSRAFEILDEIKYEIERLNSSSDSEINLILIDDDSNGNNDGCGIIQSLSCASESSGKSKSGIVLDNITDLNETDLHDSLVTVKNTASHLLYISGIRKNTDNFSAKLFYESRKSIYKGKSFLLPASILFFCNFHNKESVKYSYRISSSAAFTGALDDNGDLIKLPHSILKAKVYTAFFSWIKCIIIPEENLREAKDEISRLNLKYPGRKLNVIGLKNAADIFNYPEIIKKEKHTLKEAGLKHFRKHYLRTTIAAAVILILATLGFGKLFIKLPVKPVPQTDSEMYAVYTPESEIPWLFHNADYFSGDTINFGDVSIADMWYPQIDLINNGSKEDKFNLELEGKDKNEFEILWRQEGRQPSAPVLKPDVKQRIYIKFRPVDYSSPGLKNAVLNLYTESHPEIRKKIYLKGNSVKYDKGYSLLLNDGDDQLVVNNDKNILNDDFTISFWLKPELTGGIINDIPVMINDDGSKNKFYILISKDSCLAFNMMPNRTKPEPLYFYSKNKIIFGEWNYIAVTYNKGNAAILLNNKRSNFYFKDNPVKIIGDKISFGGIKNPDKRKTEKPGNTNFRFLLSSLKMWNAEMPERYLSANKFSNDIDTSKSLILQYDFDDMNFETVYDLSKNDLWGTIYGGVSRKMDSPDFIAGKHTSSDNAGNKVLSLGKRGIMKCPLDLFKKPSSFTMQCDLKIKVIESDIANAFFDISHPDFDAKFIYLNNNIRLCFDDKVNSLLNSKEKHYLPGDKWHRYTLCYSYENDFLVLYIDSTQFLRLDSLKSKFDVSRWFYCLSFGSASFFYSPRLIQNDIQIDNAKVFSRILSPSEIYGSNTEGLLAYWTFEHSENNLSFDEIRRIPAMLWQNFRIINENSSDD